MGHSRRSSRRAWGARALLAGALAGCGGDALEPSGSSGVPPGLVRVGLAPRGEPDAPRGLVPIPLDEELRSAVEFADAPLVGEVPSGPGAVLRFGFGLSQAPPRRAAARSAEPVRLHLSLADEGGEVFARSFRFSFGGPTRPAWKDARVPLDELPEGDLRATFRLDAGERDGFVAAIASPRVERPVASAPTVLLVTSDTHRGDHVGALGDRGVGVRTPALDTLAARGVLFEDCYSTINVTVPSHASILTSLPIRDTGVVSNAMGLTDEARTLAEVFRDAGYVTLAVASAQHLRHQISGLGQGFDRLRTPLREGAVVASRSVPQLEEWLADEEGVPVFAWLHVFDAHAPYLPPEDLRRLYYPADRDPTLPREGQPADFEGVPWEPGVRDIEYVKAQYKSEITFVDAQLASLLELPRLADAVIAFTADHGEVMDNHGLRFEHAGIYPDTLAVPLILAWPDAPRGERVARPVSLVDLGRTLLDLAGQGAAEFPGRNLLRWLGDHAPVPEPRFAIADGAGTAAIELEGWLLLLSLRDTSHPARVKHQVELYDLRRDPRCANDLVDVEHERARALRAQLIEWLDAGRGLLVRRGGLQPDVREELAELGYAEVETELDEDGWYRPDPGAEWCRRFE